MLWAAWQIALPSACPGLSEKKETKKKDTEKDEVQSQAPIPCLFTSSKYFVSAGLAQRVAEFADYTQIASIVLSANAIISLLGSFDLRKSKISK
ncbi:MAG: putative Ca2+/H+ antiporter (TMEM165/GDT1 family) [Rhodothermales bacterium]|jgi:putative Ca2+/H+ antiporter (TMEM165/GDT1 family)